jgi:hypothetical protein
MTIEYKISFSKGGFTLRQTVFPSDNGLVGSGDGAQTGPGTGDGKETGPGTGDGRETGPGTGHGKPTGPGTGDGRPTGPGGDGYASGPVVIFGPTIIGAGNWLEPAPPMEAVEVIPEVIPEIRRKV